MQKDTYEDLEEVLVDYISALGNVPPDSKEAGIIMSRVKSMIEKLNEIDQVQNKKVCDEMNHQLESDRNNLDWRKVALDLIKVFGPIIISVMSYAVLQQKLLRFEETGNLSTSASKQFSLPKFWK